MQSTLTINLNPISNYSFGTKAPKYEKDTSVQQRMDRLKEKYQQEGLRRSVDGLILVYEHNHPHVLLLQLGPSFFKLPGGRLRPGEGEIDCLVRKLNTNLAPEAEHLRPEWRIGECLGAFFRPNFDASFYPYCPPHIARPKEVRRMFLVHLPDKCYFAVPKNYKLVAVPLFEIYDHVQRYGPVISSIPQLLSRFNFVLTGGGGGAAALPPHIKEKEKSAVAQEDGGEEGKEGETQAAVAATGGEGGALLSAEGGQSAGEEPHAEVKQDDFTVDFAD